MYVLILQFTKINRAIFSREELSIRFGLASKIGKLNCAAMIGVKTFFFLVTAFASTTSCNGFVPQGLSLQAKTITAQKRVELNEKQGKGIYSRPSAAIEKGSGFFIPGLEGPRVRLVFGLVILALTAANHLLVTQTSGILAETIAVGYGILLLLQAAIEFGKEEKGFVVTLERPTDTESGTSSEKLNQRWYKGLDNSGWQEKVQWAAASYVSMTPATHFFLMENDKVIYRLGSTSMDYSDEAETAGCVAALETISKAKSGRVALPSNHPAVTNLSVEDHDRCVVLQTIDDSKSLMILSDQLLQSFTQQDLKWLGQMAAYIK